MEDDGWTRLRRVFTVQGFLATGKSTLIDRFKKAGFITVSEPLEQMTHQNLLQRFYENQDLAFAFQVIMMTLLQNKLLHVSPYAARYPDKLILIERHVLTCLVFAERLKQKGHLQEWQLDYLKMLGDMMVKNFWLADPDEINAVIFLRASPEVIQQRLKRRSRCDGELQAFMDVKDIERFQDEMFDHAKTLSNNVHVINTDNKTPEMVESEAIQFISMHYSY